MPSKFSLPKLSNMHYNFAPVLQNKLVLYAFLAMTIIQVVFFVNSGNVAPLITMGLVGFITSFFSKNMIVILCVALTVSSILTYGIRANTHEGLENKEEPETKETEPEEKTAPVEKNKTEVDVPNSAETSDKTKDEKKEEYENLKKDFPEYKEIQDEILKGIERMDPLLQKAEAFINKYSDYKKN